MRKRFPVYIIGAAGSRATPGILCSVFQKRSNKKT